MDLDGYSTAFVAVLSLDSSVKLRMAALYLGS